MNKPTSNILAYILTLALVFIWSIPGTIALRLFLLLGALAAVASCSEVRNRTQNKQFSFPLITLTLLSIWFVFQAIFISEETAWALKELRGQWLTALAAFVLGALMSKLDIKPQTRASSLWTGIALVFAAQAGMAVCQSLWHWYTHGSMLRGLVPLTGGKLEMSYLVNLLLAIISADIFFRATAHHALLRIPVSFSLVCAALGMTANFLAGSRNGILGTVFLALSLTFLFLFDGRQKLGGKKTFSIATFIIIGVAGFALASYQSDPRWKTFYETARIAVDIDQQKAWYDPDNTPLPLLSNGAPVEGSAYLRIAWISAGIRFAKDIPYGVGYGRNAFVRALRRSGYPAKVGHSHSGFIDLLSGGGIPAVVLWFIFIGSLIVAGWRSFSRYRNPLGLLLILLASGYTGRMMIESVNKDHMLQIFFFLIGALVAANTSPLRDNICDNNPMSSQEKPKTPTSLRFFAPQ